MLWRHQRYQVTKLRRWGVAPSKSPLFTVVPLQAARSNAIYGDPARCPGEDWRIAIYGSRSLTKWGLEPSKIMFGVDASII